MSKRAVLVDGSGFVFRAFFASPHLSHNDNDQLGAVYGFCSMILKQLSERGADIFVIVFDAGGKTFRHDIFSEYKANRPVTPDALCKQFPIILEACDAFGISVVSKKGFEADDILATYANDLANQNISVEIVSVDKDLAQLVNEKISLVDPAHDKIIDRNEVVRKYGVSPENMIFFQALVGDKVDNVPGVFGIGLKGAAKLISQFGTLQNLYENIDSITPVKLREKLCTGKDAAFLSLKLVSLDHNVDVEKKYNAVDYNIDRILQFLDKYGFASLINRAKKLQHAYDLCLI